MQITLIALLPAALSLILPITTAQPANKLPTHPTPTAPISEDPLPLGPIRWHGPITEGGENITIHGLHHEVTAKLHELQPYWMKNGTIIEEHARKLQEMYPEMNSSAPTLGLEKRGGRSSYACWDGYAGGSLSAAKAGYWYIATHYGLGNCAVGPRACGRFACSYNTATLMCNSENNWAEVPCMILAMNADFVTNTCARGNTVEGQAWYVGPDYNVLVKQTGPGNGC